MTDKIWTRTTRRIIADRQGWLCHWCGVPMSSTPNCPRQVTLDHLTPKYAGGKDRIDNTVAACRTCNSERHPEMNRRKAEEPLLVAVVGDPEPQSPFAVLKGLIR
jgi:5-methylcytosine-specific restriction endonuclease McrA